MRMTYAESAPGIGVIRVGSCLCDEAIDLLEAAPLFGRDVVELDAVCQRLLGIARLLGLKDWKLRLKALRETLVEEAKRKRMLRAIKRVRKQGRATRDSNAAKRAAAFVDELPACPISPMRAGELAGFFAELKLALETAGMSAEIDDLWLQCRRDYGRVRGLGAAWRDGETRVEYDELAAVIRSVYTQLLIMAPTHAIDGDDWESLIWTVETLGALSALRRHLNRSGRRVSPAYVVPRTIDLLDRLSDDLDARAAEGHAVCFEKRPRSYFSSLRRR